MDENKDRIEAEATQFLVMVYKNTPHDVLNQWGMKRYSRFKTVCWKIFETTTSLDSFIAGYFKYYPIIGMPKIIEFLKSIDNKSDVFAYLRQNLVILIGRMQFIVKKDKEIKTVNDEEVKSAI